MGLLRELGVLLLVLVLAARVGLPVRAVEYSGRSECRRTMDSSVFKGPREYWALAAPLRTEGGWVCRVGWVWVRW